MSVSTINENCTLSMFNNNICYTTNTVTNGSISWPLTLTGTITVTIGSNLTVNSVSNYFIINNGNTVTIAGNYKIITVDGVSGYYGLVYSRSSSTIVQNLGVITVNGSTLAHDGGWIGRSNGTYGMGFIGTINYCYSTGDVQGYGGGITGSYSGFGGSCNINNCFSTGAVGGGYEQLGGGIIGYFSTNCNITNCYSTGTLGTSCGGFFGGYSTTNSNITNSYCIGGTSLVGNGSISGTITNTFASNGWDNATALSTLDNTLSVWKVNSNNYQWKLNAFVNDVTYNYNTSTLTYTNNKYPINTYQTATTIKLINNNSVQGTSAAITLTDKTIQIPISSVYLNLPVYIAVTNSNTIIDYIDPVTINQTIPVTSISLDQTNVTLEISETATITATATPANADFTGVIWTTSDVTIATVSSAGLVTGIKAGSVTITASSISNNTITQTASITVNPYRIKLYMSGGQVVYSVNNNVSTSPVTWPLTLTGTMTVYLEEDLILSNASNYFIINNGNTITIDGKYHTITINGVTGYYGLVYSRSTSTIVQSLGIVTSNGSTLGNDGGWIGRSTGVYGNGFLGTINNSYTTGNVPGFSGGMTGSYSGFGGSCNINNSFTTGSTSDSFGGCIVGYYSKNCNLTNCYSAGTVGGTYCGGFIGGYSDSSTITNSYCIGGDALGVYTTATITNSFASNGWDNAAALANLDNTSNVWKVISNHPWKLNVFVNDITYNNTTSTLTYTNNKYPINAYQSATTVKLINSNSIQGTSTSIALTDRSIQIPISGIYLNIPVYVAVTNSNTVIDYVDIVTINQSILVTSISLDQTSLTLEISETSTITATVTPPNADFTGVVWTTSDSNIATVSSSGLVTGIAGGSVTITATSISDNTVTQTASVTVNPNRIKLYMSAGQVVYSENNNPTTSPVTWPLSLTGPITVYLEEDLTFNNINNYFSITGSNAVTIDGKYHTITIDGVTDYVGLVYSRLNSTIVQNIGVLTSNNSTLTMYSGWIGRCTPTYATDFIGTINNCYTTGNLRTGCGGIVGLGAGYGGTCTITNCFTTGNIGDGYVEQNAGGIAGYYAGYNGSCIIINCYSTGTIAPNCGGIIGYSGFTYTITNCYTIGGSSLVGPGSSSGTITHSFANNGWDNSLALANLDNTSNVWKVLDSQAWKLNVFLNDVTYDYTNTVNDQIYLIKVLTYKNNKIPINAYANATHVNFINTTNILPNTNLPITLNDRSILQETIGVSFNLPIYIAVYNNSTLIDYIDSFTISQTISVTDVSLDKTSIIMGINDVDIITPTITPLNADYPEIIWISSNTNVATVSDGYVVGIAGGSATITAQSVSDNTITKTVSVSIVNVTRLYMYNGVVVYSQDNGITKIPVTWPYTLSGSTTISIEENLIFNDVSNYFIIDSGTTVTINGNNYTITIDGVTNYRGMVYSRSNDTIIENIGVLTSNNTTLNEADGWIGRGATINTDAFLGTVTNCYSTGNIPTGGGGIVGNTAGYGGTCNVSNCYSTGIIAGSGGGSGGIVGGSCGYNGTCNITNCYSIGDINGNSSGGICGNSAGIYNNGICNVTNCYSTGVIGNSYTGGIVGSYSGYGGGICNVTNCYTTGALSGFRSGGITGIDCIVTVTSSYTTGIITGGNAGPVFPNNSSPTNNNSHTDGWDYTTAINTLDNSQSVWKIIKNSEPWKISAILNDINYNTVGTILTYTNNKFPINIFSSVNYIKLINSTGIQGSAISIGLSDKTIAFSISNLFLNIPIYVALYNNNTLVDYADIVTVSQNISVTNVSLDKSDIFLGVQETSLITATISPINADYQDVIWTSTDNNIVSVSSSGLVTGINTGQVTITATSVSDNNILATCIVTVGIINVTSISFDQTDISLLINQTATITATVLPSNAADKTYTWSSSDDNIATVVNGVVTAIAVGSATITAITNDGGLTATANITVNQLTYINFNCKLYMDAGQVKYSTNNGITKINIFWPSTIADISTVILAEDLTFNDQTNYFIINDGSTVILDGNYHTITIDGITDYNGVVESHSSSTIIQKLGVLTSNGSTLGYSYGWIGSSFFLGNINNCYSTGIINNNSVGGIVGMSCAKNGICNITNCYSTGIISGDYCGGIAGFHTGDTGICNINNCYTTGEITGYSAGGIVGHVTPYYGTCNITNCYSTGDINNSLASAIGPVTTGLDGSCNITNFYSSGIISYGPTDIIFSSQAVITNYNHTTGWDDSVAAITLDNTNNTWKILNNNYPWKLKLLLNSLIIDYSGNILSYTNNKFPISTFELVTNIKVFHNGNTLPVANVPITINDRTFTINSITLSLDLPTYLVLYNGSTIIDYADVFIGSVNFEETEISLNITDTITIIPSVVPSNQSSTLTWITSNKLIAIVNNGIISCVRSGTALISALLQNKYIVGSVIVHVVVPVTDIILSSSDVTLDVGATTTITASVLPKNATNKTITWESNDTNLATISNTGLITGINPGSSTITASTENNIIATANFNILNPVTNIAFTTNSLSVREQIQTDLNTLITFTPVDATDQSLRWISNNRNVATVSSSGIVTGIKGGTVIISAISNNDIIAQLSVIVTVPVVNIDFNIASISLIANTTKTIPVYFIPINATNKSLTWTSSNNNIATVSDGVITGLNSGQVTITARSIDNSFAFTTLTANILVPVTSITFNNTYITGNVLTQITIIATVLPVNATDKSLIWTSSNETVATVNNGIVTSLKAGKVTIKARSVSTQNIVQSAFITFINVDVQSISLNNPIFSLKQLTTYRLVAFILPLNATNQTILWSSSDPAIATVSDTGLVTGVSVGSVLITARSASNTTKLAISAVTIFN